jgi:hypothetical protein
VSTVQMLATLTELSQPSQLSRFESGIAFVFSIGTG